MRFWLFILSTLLLSACSLSDRHAVDKLNSLSYACHYRNIDSTEHYAQEAYKKASNYDDGRAEALNNLAFVSMVRMDYEQAEQLLQEAIRMTDSQIEQLVGEIGYMRLCQRRSANRAFYEHRELAQQHLNRINEERSTLSERLQQRMIYAESEMAIVNSIYYYYVGLERQSVQALNELDKDAVRRDTAQYLNFLYNVGAGGILTEGSPEQIQRDEMEFLNRCLLIAQRHHYPYFEAQAQEAMAEHTGDVTLAEEALRGFQRYGDVYQIAGAYRTLASCYHAMGNDRRALEHLHMALADSAILQAPDLVASIREQLSVAYAAINDKSQSDYNRNIYIDLQEQTRQDRELEARAGLLDKTVSQLNMMIWAVLGAIVLLLLLLWLFNHLNKKHKEDHLLDDLLEQKTDEVAEARLRVEKNERRQLEQRAKVSLAVSILPLIDRIRYAVGHLSKDQAQLEYIRELTDNINEQNDLLTEWIQLRQGEVSLHIESFDMQPLFDIVARGKSSFEMKGITLHVEATSASVKADRVLTLFMLNTLADNARKFTDQGGSVSISACEQEHFVEIAIQDTGCGMDEQQLAHLFDHKPVTTHGFGLMNCKGIIEKYKKMSPLFSVCMIAAESKEGHGSRFYFRLPKGVRRAVLLLVLLLSSLVPSVSLQAAETAYLNKAHIMADSAYFCNINGHYQRTLQYADSCREYLNRHYLSLEPQGQLLMTRHEDAHAIPPEIQWLHQGLHTNYQIVLDIRNESAVAALALHEWQLYTYNNKVYTQLFKEMSADSGLADYCRRMQQSQQNRRVAVILLLVMLVLLLPAYYMLYYRHRLHERFRRERMQQTHIELADDDLRRAELENANLHVANSVLDNCLSTLKHETMYYPSRIRQLVDTRQVDMLDEVAGYYRELYGMLIQQAISQTDRIHLHVKPLLLYGQQVLGDENLLRYLFELLKSQEVEGAVKDERYVQFTVHHSPLAVGDTHKSYFEKLLCRQIVRDHGEATNRRGCGISHVNEQIIIILPRYNGQL